MCVNFDTHKACAAVSGCSLPTLAIFVKSRIPELCLFQRMSRALRHLERPRGAFKPSYDGPENKWPSHPLIRQHAHLVRQTTYPPASRPAIFPACPQIQFRTANFRWSIQPECGFDTYEHVAAADFGRNQMRVELKWNLPAFRNAQLSQLPVNGVIYPCLRRIYAQVIHKTAGLFTDYSDPIVT